MSEETVCCLKGYIEYDKIIKYIEENIGSVIQNNITENKICKLTDLDIQSYEGNENKPIIYPKNNDDLIYWRDIAGYLYFIWHEYKYGMFYYYSPITSRQGYYEYTNDPDIIELANTDTTTLKMYASQESVKLLTAIAKYFNGGWIDENDSDNRDFYKIK